MIGANGHVKVTDFGTELMGIDEESMKNTFVGTAEYMSPELFDEEDAIIMRYLGPWLHPAPAVIREDSVSCGYGVHDRRSDSRVL